MGEIAYELFSTVGAAICRPPAEVTKTGGGATKPEGFPFEGKLSFCLSKMTDEV